MATCRQHFAARRISLAQLQLDASRAVGAGRFGLVMKGWLLAKGGHPALTASRAVAVKTIRSSDDVTLTQFLLEMRLLAAMRHPNLVSLLAVQEAELPLLLVMELCEGGDLRQCLRAGPSHLQAAGLTCPTMSEAYLDFCCQAAAGLEYLHSKLCIHRDVAARNILLTSSSQPAGGSGLTLKLADLGLARMVLTEEDYYKSSTDQDAVPLRWQCPLAVTTRTYTTKSDVYSFGVLMWEIYHQGATPFSEILTGDVLRCVQSGGQLAWRCEPPAPVRVIEVMRSCCKLNPAQRPAMAWVGAELGRIQGGTQSGFSMMAVNPAYSMESLDVEAERESSL